MLKTNLRKEKAQNQTTKQLTGAVASGDEADESDSDSETAGVMSKKVSEAIL